MTGRKRAVDILLWIVIVLVVLWLLGFAIPGFAFGGLIHILVVIAVILFIIWLVRRMSGGRSV
jgi:uncharacterized membrane protein